MTFELGVNYWPRRRAMYMWRELDLGEVREEMAQIAAMGFDVVRLFALTRDFLPEPAAAVFRALRRRRDAGALVRGDAPRGVLDVDADTYYRAPAAHFARLYDRWCSTTDQ